MCNSLTIKSLVLVTLCVFSIPTYAQTKAANLGTTYSKFASELANLGVSMSFEESPIDSSEMRWMGTAGNVIIELYGNAVSYQLRKIYVAAFFSNTDNIANMNSLAALLSPIVGALPKDARRPVTMWVTDQVSLAATSTAPRIVKNHHTRGFVFTLTYERNLGLWSLSVERS